MEVKTSTFGETSKSLGDAQQITTPETPIVTATIPEATVTTEQPLVPDIPQEVIAAAPEENVAAFSLGMTEEEVPVINNTPQAATPSFNFDEEIKKLDRKEVLKKLGVNDFALEIDEYLAKGGKAADYLSAKAIDYNSISDQDIMKADLRKQYPTFTPQQIDLMFNRKYAVSEIAEEEEKEFVALTLKADAYNSRQSKIQEQQKFVIPDTPILQKDEAYEQWKQSQESQPKLMEQLRSFYATHEATKNLNESKRVAVELGEGVSPFNFSIDRPELLTQMFTDGGELWGKVTSTKTGEPDVRKQQLIAMFSFNPQKFIQDIFTYGQKMGVQKELVEGGQNAQRPQAKIAAMETNTGQNVGLGKFSDRTRN